MKEKITAYLCSWKFCLHANIVFLVWDAILFIIEPHAAYMGGVVYHLGFGIASLILMLYDNRHVKDRYLIGFLDHLSVGLIRELDRYKKLYGELPSEEEKQGTEESEK